MDLGTTCRAEPKVLGTGSGTGGSVMASGGVAT
jgi:hypothetical protein